MEFGNAEEERKTRTKTLDSGRRFHTWLCGRMPTAMSEG
jgi:hypothetical protein